MTSPSGIHRFLNRIETPSPSILNWRLARAESQVGLPFHPPLVLLGRCRQELFRYANPTTPRRGSFHSLVDLQAAIIRYLGDILIKLANNWSNRRLAELTPWARAPATR